MSVAVVVGVLLVPLWLWSVVYIVHVRLEPRRLRADAEVRRAYLLHVRVQDAEPEVLARQIRTYHMVNLVVVTIVAGVCVVILLDLL